MVSLDGTKGHKGSEGAKNPQNYNRGTRALPSALPAIKKSSNFKGILRFLWGSFYLTDYLSEEAKKKGGQFFSNKGPLKL